MPRYDNRQSEVGSAISISLITRFRRNGPRLFAWAASLLALCLVSATCRLAFAAEPKAKGRHVLDAVPQGYFLHAYDDCGIPQRQPHVQMQDSYCWTFATSDTDADEKSRSAVFSYKAVKLRYADLDRRWSTG